MKDFVDMVYHAQSTIILNTFPIILEKQKCFLRVNNVRGITKVQPV